jgi:ABC-2 type transport system ATP-binding protein
VGVVPDEVSFPLCMNGAQVGKMMRNTYKNWDQALYEDYLAKFELPPKKRFKDYSKGMKMKLGIAVALAHDAKLLILDEATGGLDPVVRDEVVSLFGEFTRSEDRAVFISSHIVSDLEKICDYIAFMHSGKLLLLEEKDLLLARYGCWHGSAEEAALLPEGAVVGKRETPYGVDAVLLRGELKEDLPLSPINMEELFLTVVKEAKK